MEKSKITITSPASKKIHFAKIPCKVGDMVYRVWSCGLNGKSVAKFVVTGVHCDEDCGWYVTYIQPKRRYCSPIRKTSFDNFDKILFTSEEAVKKEIKKIRM